jgi:hypothetical protein
VTLLRLTPDGERLRRIAKAHAAGELSTSDYRRIRSDVIERFAALDGDITGDDTQQRWIDRTPVAAADAAGVTAQLRPARPLRVFWVMVGGLLLLVLLACGIF